jgi:hypothetical protein
MRKLWTIALLVPVLLLLAVGREGFGGAQALPTPVGHLGGPVPLTPDEQQETPTPLPTPTQATPVGETGPAGCDVAPLSLDEAISRLTGSVPSSGSSAPAESVEATLATFVACLNAGDYLRMAAITTPEFFAALVAGTGWPEDQLSAKLSALHPRDPDLFLRIVAVGTVVDQSGGDAALTATLIDPATPFLGATEYGARFVHGDSRWLLADLEPVSR